MTPEYRLGKKAPDPTKPRLRLAGFIDATAPVNPVAVDWLTKVPKWNMYLNDQIGDCTIASGAHQIMSLSTYSQQYAQSVTDADVVAAYSAVSGYDPKTGANDYGAVLQDVMNYWRKTGIGGHKILAFAAVDVKNKQEVDAAINVFGTLSLGIALPISAQKQTGPDKVWEFDPVSTSGRYGSWGGHAVPVGKYDDNANRYTVVTWGALQDLSEDFWNAYVDEAWVVITQEWLDASGRTPGGIDLFGLGEDFARLTGGSNPFPAPAPVLPTPTPVVDPPAPTPVETPDEALAVFAYDWLSYRHRGRNRKFGAQVAAWLRVKNL